MIGGIALHFPGATERNDEDLLQDSQYLGRDMESGAPEYGAQSVTHSVTAFVERITLLIVHDICRIVKEK
jgi:hypothetical protein